MSHSRLKCLSSIIGGLIMFCGVSRAQQGGADCLVDGVLRRNGERFDFQCKGVCQCENGNIRCLSSCPPYAGPPECKTLKKAGHCCRQLHCPNATSKGACNTDLGALVPLNHQLPWLLSINVKNGSQSSNCVAVVFDATSAMASPDCSADSNSRIIYPTKVANFSIFASSQKPMNNGKSYVTRLSITEKPGGGGTEFYRDFHEINIPYNEACLRSDCALHIGAFNPMSNKFKMIPAMQTQPEQCQIDAADLDKGIRCLEIRSQDYPDCINLAGGVVSISLDDYFFLKGFVTQSPFLRKEPNRCDSEQSKFRRYYDFCSDFSKTPFRDL